MPTLPEGERDALSGKDQAKPNTVLILLGLLIGLVGGALLATADPSIRQPVLAIAAPVGRLWIDALTMTIVPLVFGLLVTGMGAAASSAVSGSVALRGLAWFGVLLLASCALGGVLASLGLRWAPVPAEAGGLRGQLGAGPVLPPPGAWLSGLIPPNPIKAAADTAMAPLVVFALIFGLAATRIEASLRVSLERFFQAVVQAMLVIVHWVLFLAPLGVLALALGVGARMGTGAFGALVHYVVLIASICLAVTGFAYMTVAVVGRVSPLAFGRAALPAQVVALSTQSSLASLPAMISAAGPLGVPSSSAAIVLPLAVSIFRAASAAANIAVAVYLAHLHGVTLAPATLTVGVAVAAVVSLAAVGLPAQVSFFTTIGPVCLAMGVPIQALPLLLAVETLPDIFRTLGNVTWDLAVTRIAGRSARSELARADARARVPRV